MNLRGFELGIGFECINFHPVKKEKGGMQRQGYNIIM